MVDIIEQKRFYHRECCKTFWNLNEVKRAEKRFNGLYNYKQSAQIMLDRNVRWPSFKQGNQLECENLPMLRRLQFETYNKKLSSKGFYRRLNRISEADDAPADDVMHRNTCLVMLKEKMIKRELIFYGS